VIGGTNSENANGNSGWRGYDGRETDAWACGIVMYALVCRALPFGEGPGANGADGAGMRGEIKAGQRRDRGMEREGRRHWLMRIARADWPWPQVPEASGLDQDSLYGPHLVESVGAKRVIGSLLVRDPKKRAKVGELWSDEWMREGRAEYQYHRRSGSQGSSRSRKSGLGEMVVTTVDEDEEDEEEGELVDKEGIDGVACQEVL
jgi:protein-serine/threonine kinase